MKRWIAVGLVGTMAWGLVPPKSARANITVHDPIHTIETIAQAIQSANHYYAILKRLENPEWRDLLIVVSLAREAARIAEAMSYADPEVLGKFFEKFPAYLALTEDLIRAGITAERLVNHWRKVRRDTAAGAVGSVARFARDYEKVRASLEIVKAQANAAAGSGEALQAQSELVALQVQETMKTNEALGALVQMQATALGEQAAREGLFWAQEAAVLVNRVEQSYGEFPTWP